VFWLKKSKTNSTNGKIIETKKKFKPYQIWIAPYVDGNLGADTGAAVAVALLDDSIHLSWDAVREHAQIPFVRLDRVTTKTEQEIYRDVTVGRLLLFGILAFGMKKKHVTRKSYTVISGKDAAGQPIHAILGLSANWQSRRATEKINEARAKYLEAHPEEVAQAAETVEADEPTNSAADPIEQIKKLKDLLDAGAITESEFEAKKADLLGRI